MPSIVASFFQKETATIMEVAEDYGLTPIAFWFVLMTLGFALSLYITFVRCWARITPHPDEPGRSVVLLGGLAEKNKITFEAEFEKLALRVRDHLAASVQQLAVSRQPSAVSTEHGTRNAEYATRNEAES